MATKITLTFAGDAGSLVKAAKDSDQAMTKVGDSADSAGAQLTIAAQESTSLSDRMGRLGAAVSGATDALDAVGGSLQAVVDLQQAGAERASRLARALVNVEQAQEDLNQAQRDGAQAQLDTNQAAIDLEQANIDASVAIKEHAAAVKEFGAGSDEARQAALDLRQATQDAAQAQEDQAQFSRDAAQALIDAKTAQLDLADAQREAKPPELQKWADQLGLITPLLSALVGIIGLVTAVQWAWNVAMTANPIGLVVVAVAALIAAVVLIATKTTWFQDLWARSWGVIKREASAVWEWIKIAARELGETFQAMADVITWPFKTAFNAIAKMWNATIGSLKWTVPGWVPGIGGNTITGQKIPTFHSGGIVPGVPGQEVLAVLQAGETVTPRGQSGGTQVGLPSGASGLDRLFLNWLLELLRGNNLVLVKR